MMAATNQPACIFSPYEEDLALMVAPVVPAMTENDSKIRKNLTTEFAIIQDSKMDVFLRVRPLTSKERKEDSEESCLEIQSKKEVLLKAPAMSATFKNNPHNVDRLNTKFTFTEIFGPETTQHEFYLSAVDKTVQQFLDGQNCLIFAYGATNSGKTHTVQGPPDNPGVIPLALDVIFHNLKDNLAELPQYRPISSVAIEELLPKDRHIELEIKESLIAGMSEGFHFSSSKDSVAVSQESLDIFENTNIVASSKVTLQDEMLANSTFMIYVSFAEIYNEQLFDLLSHCVDPKKRPKLNLVHDASGNPFIKGLRKIWVSSVEEALKLLQVGRRNLHMAATKLNNQSSRSHCVFSVYVIRVINSNPVLAYVNNLSFCDLAGSERVVKTKNTGERLKEAGNINTSLMVLGRCIDILRNNQANPKDKSTNVVPYRDSKITRLFQSFFNGQGKASMIINVAPNCSMFDDTLKVMKFSALAKQVVSKDQVERSVLNISSISERLTNFWVKSNRRWSSIAANCPKQSIMTIPEAEWNTLVEDEEEMEEEDDEIDSEQVQDLMHDIRELTNLAEEQEQKIKELKQRNKELEKEVEEIAQKTKDEDYAFFKEHTKLMDENHKEAMERREEIANDILNRRTALLEEYIAQITRKSQTSEEDEEDSDNESSDYDEIVEKLEASQQANETLKKENQSLQEKLALLVESIDNNKEVVEKFNDAQNSIQTLNEEKQELEDKILQLQNEIIGHNKIDEKLEEALNSNEILRNEMYKLQENIDRLQKECVHCNEVLEKLNNAENSIDSLKKENQELEEKLEQQQDKAIGLDKINEKLEEARNSVETFKKENDELRQKLSLLQDKSIDLDIMSEKLKEAHSSVETFKKENDELRQKLSLLQDKSIGLDKMSEKLEEAHSSVETFKKENDEIRQKLSLLQNKLHSHDEMVLEFESSKGANKTLKKANKKLEEKITLLKEKTINHDIILEKLAVAECSSESLRKENVELQTNYQKLLEELNSTKSKIDHQEKQSSTHETVKLAEADELKKEITILKEKETALRSELANTSTELKKSQEEFDKLINIILEKDSHVGELTDKVKDLEAKLNEVSKENIRQTRRKATSSSRLRRKQYKPVPETSSEDEFQSSNNPSTSREKLTELPVASRSPLAVLDSVLQQSPTMGAAYNAVKRGFERVTKVFQSPIQPSPTSAILSRPKRQTRKLYEAKTEFLDTSPSNDPSPPKMPRKPVRVASLRTTRSSKK